MIKPKRKKIFQYDLLVLALFSPFVRFIIISYSNIHHLVSMIFFPKSSFLLDTPVVHGILFHIRWSYSMSCSYTSILATSHQHLYFVTPIILKQIWKWFEIMKELRSGILFISEILLRVLVRLCAIVLVIFVKGQHR